MRVIRILSTSAEIRDEISRLMEPGTRRIAITAFVGAGATAYMPKPKGVSVVCWPKAGGTTPNAIRELIDRGANVRFADRLHMKMYWAKGRGAVIGSANLSTNALGAGGLKELAVLLPDDAIPIAKLLKAIQSRPVSEKELLGLEHVHRRIGRRFIGSEPQVSFDKWYDSKNRNPWKLGWWDEPAEYSSKAKAEAKAQFGKAPYNSIWGRAADYKKSDWVLMFRLSNVRAWDAVWLYVNFCVKADKSSSDYPFEAVQVWTPRECTTPPFSLGGGFRKRLNAACRTYGIARLKKLSTVTPPDEFLALLRAASLEQTR